MEWAYVLYAGAGQQLWHQRWVAGRVALSASDCITLSPDGDLVVEDFGGDNADIAAVRWGGFDQPPIGVPRGSVYRFRQRLEAAELLQRRRESELVAEQECRRRAIAIGQLQLLNGISWLVPVSGPAEAYSERSPDWLWGTSRGSWPPPRRLSPSLSGGQRWRWRLSGTATWLTITWRRDRWWGRETFTRSRVGRGFSGSWSLLRRRSRFSRGLSTATRGSFRSRGTRRASVSLRGMSWRLGVRRRLQGRLAVARPPHGPLVYQVHRG